MKTTKRFKIFTLLMAITLVFAVCFSGCFFPIDDDTTETAYVISVQSNGINSKNESEFIVNYSDGKSTTFVVKNGKDGQDVTIDDIYEKYCLEVEEVTYEEFLAKYFSTTEIDVPEGDNAKAIAKSLGSSLKLYTEFYTQSGYSSYTQGLASGSATFIKMDDTYVYAVTNFHVLYLDGAINDGFAVDIQGYLYGSEDSPTKLTSTNSYGCNTLSYGDYAIEFERVGETASYDLALIRAKKSDVFAINPYIRISEIATDYNVGESVYAIGNTEDMGISVTQGIVSVDREMASFNIDGNTRSFWCLRFDASINHGNSGGGLFNKKGELVGVTNGGHIHGTNTEGDDIASMVNYAIPCDTVKNVIDNIYYYATDENSSTNGVYVPTFGLTVTGANSKYVYDEETGYGRIEEETLVDTTSSGLFYGKIQANDILLSVTVDGEEIELTRYFFLGNATLKARAGSVITIEYKRNGTTATTSATVSSSALSKKA